MALNYSPRITEDNMWSPMRRVSGYLSEGVSEMNGESFHARPWHVNRGESEDWRFNFKGDSFGFFCSPEPNSRDVIDLLPSDPFGMDMGTTFTAITGGLFSDRSNLIWSNASTFQPFSSSILRANEKPCRVTHSFPSDVMCDDMLNMVINGITSCGSEVQVEEKASEGGAKSERIPLEVQVEEKASEGGAKSEGIPFEALLSILNFLGVKDLLSVESVCKSLCSTVRSEPWLWRSIQIESPLNERITDDSLFQLVTRAGGRLQSLCLVECPKVTDYGIRRILERNPQLTKLSVPGCTRLTVEGTLNNIKMHNSSKGVLGIKHLRIGQLFGVTREHFQELNSLLGLDGVKPENHQKPHFYHRGNFYLPFDDDRAMDIDMCPRCEKFRLVYNCPAEGCQVKEPEVSQVCRACAICIPRCAHCGVCISDNEYVETFCLDLLCSDCFKQTLKCVEKLDKKVVTPLHQRVTA